MNPIAKFFLKIISSPKINMQEDYVWVRKMQDFLAWKPKDEYRILDRKIYAEDGSHNIPVRIFRPKEKKHDDILLFFHGGGWVLGNIDTYTRDCIKMADQSGRGVLSVDYRKAPEFPFPAGFDDCFRVADVLVHNPELAGVSDSSDITLVGNSAGANLAAAVSLRLRDENKKIPGKQILINPVVYWDHSEDSPFDSVRENGFDYGLTSKKMQEYMEMYEPDEEVRKSPYISPLMASDLTKQPKTLVVTSEFDPLRDEGKAYGMALREAGNDVHIICVKDTIHDFLSKPLNAEPARKTYAVFNEFLHDSTEGSEVIGEQSNAATEKVGTSG